MMVLIGIAMLATPADVLARPANNPDDCTVCEVWDGAKKECLPLSVALSAVSMGNTPDVSPRICLNAQPEYQKAKWKATITGGNGQAILNIVSGDISANPMPGNSVSDGDIITLTGNAKGNYKIKLTHSQANGCVAYGDSEVFELRFENVALLTDEPLNEAYRTRNVTAMGDRDFGAAVTVTLPGCPGEGCLSVPLSESVTASTTWKYKLIADPVGFSGFVECSSDIITDNSGTLSASVPFLGCFDPEFLGWVCSAESRSEHEIIVSGLATGNGTESGAAFSAEVPWLGVINGRTVSFEGENVEWYRETAKYQVGREVSATGVAALSADRASSLKLPSCSGNATESGFLFLPGQFKIVE
jgi:hypothetical protein